MSTEKDKEETTEAVTEKAEKPSEAPTGPAEVTPEAAAPEEEIVEERLYTVPLRRAFWTGSRLHRSNQAIRVLKEFVTRHMKPEGLLIQPEVNDRIWARGIQKPPRRIRVRVTKNSDNLVRVYLAEG
jgi:large subunit ribosomal protein L31e